MLSIRKIVVNPLNKEGGRPLKFLSLSKILMFTAFTLFMGSLVGAQESSTEKNFLQNPDRLFDIKIPEGFESEAVDEPGILRWKKDSGEIYLIIGDLFGESGDALYKVLKNAAEKNKNVQEVKSVKVKGGKALTYKDKGTGESGGLTTWHFMVLTNNKIITMDFSAPTVDFKKFVPDFQATINSFKLKSAS
jgi:hypothetical protein